MKIKMLRGGYKDAKTFKPLKKDQEIEVSTERGERAVRQGIAIEVKSESKKSKQEKVSEETVKK